MPIHDWSRVDAGVFHDFHQAWIVAIRNALNEGVLPPDYYALAEQVAGSAIPDVVTLERRKDRGNGEQGAAITAESGQSGRRVQDPAIAVAERPPQLQYTHTPDQDPYAARATRIAIRHVSGDEVVGYIEIVSPGNKHSEAAIRQFCEKIANALRAGCHAIVIDLHGPTPRDPNGIHARFWRDHFGETCPGVTSDLPLGLSAYRSDIFPTAYFEPTAVGRALTDMPAFLTPDTYVNVPMESSYQEAWRGVPHRWKEVIEK